MTFSQYLRRSYRWYEVDEIVRWKFKPDRLIRLSDCFQSLQRPDHLAAFNMLCEHNRCAEEVGYYVNSKPCPDMKRM